MSSPPPNNPLGIPIIGEKKDNPLGIPIIGVAPEGAKDFNLQLLSPTIVGLRPEERKKLESLQMKKKRLKYISMAWAGFVKAQPERAFKAYQNRDVTNFPELLAQYMAQEQFSELSLMSQEGPTKNRFFINLPSGQIETLRQTGRSQYDIAVDMFRDMLGTLNSKERDSILRGEIDKATTGRFHSAANNIIQNIGRTGLAIPVAVGDLASVLMGGDLAVSKAIAAEFAQSYPLNPDHEEELLTHTLPGGAASILMFAMAGASGAGSKLGQALGQEKAVQLMVGTMGAGMGLNQASASVIAMEEDPTVKQAMLLYGGHGLLGASDAIPFMNALKRLNRATKGKFTKSLVTKIPNLLKEKGLASTGEVLSWQGFMEATQEFGQEFGGVMVDIMADTGVDKDFKDAIMSGLKGAEAGGILGVAMGVGIISLGKVRKRVEGGRKLSEKELEEFRVQVGKEVEEHYKKFGSIRLLDIESIRANITDTPQQKGPRDAQAKVPDQSKGEGKAQSQKEGDVSKGPDKGRAEGTSFEVGEDVGVRTLDGVKVGNLMGYWHSMPVVKVGPAHFLTVPSQLQKIETTPLSTADLDKAAKTVSVRRREDPEVENVKEKFREARGLSKDALTPFDAEFFLKGLSPDQPITVEVPQGPDVKRTAGEVAQSLAQRNLEDAFGGVSRAAEEGGADLAAFEAAAEKSALEALRKEGGLVPPTGAAPGELGPTQAQAENTIINARAGIARSEKILSHLRTLPEDTTWEEARKAFPGYSNAFIKSSATRDAVIGELERQIGLLEGNVKGAQQELLPGAQEPPTQLSAGIPFPGKAPTPGLKLPKETEKPHIVDANIPQAQRALQLKQEISQADGLDLDAERQETELTDLLNDPKTGGEVIAALNPAPGPRPEPIDSIDAVDSPLIRKISTASMRLLQRAGETGSATYKIGRQIFQPHGIAGLLEGKGPIGKKMGKEIRSTSVRINSKSKGNELAAGEVLRGLSVEQRRAITLNMNRGRKLPPGLRDKVSKLRDVLDRDLNDVLEVGVKHRFSDKGKMPLKGSGKAMPEFLNKEGQRLMHAVRGKGEGHPKVVAEANKIYKRQGPGGTGEFKNIDEVFQKLKQTADWRLRGVNPYFEQTRLQFSENLIEWDPLRVLDRHFESTAKTIEIAREWGPQLKVLEGTLAKAQAEGELTAWEANHIRNYMKAQSGVPGMIPEHSTITGGIVSNYQTITRLGFSLTSALRNYFQRFTNTIDYPIMDQIRAFSDLPPLYQLYSKEAQKLHDNLLATGAVRQATPLGTVAQESVGGRLAEASMAPFTLVERGNQGVAANLVLRYGVEKDIRRLIKKNPNSKMRKMFDVLLMDRVGRGEASTRRRLEKRGLGKDRVDEMLKSGISNLTVEEAGAITQKFTEDTQFALTFASTPSWWVNSPWARNLFKFKTFGVRQVSFVWDHVAREAFQYGNFAPLTRFFMWTALSGEVYNVVRDQLLGKEEALSTKMRKRPESVTGGVIAKNLLTNFVDGGGVGMLGDLMWGVGDIILGPLGSTAENLGKMGVDVALKTDPKQAVRAFKDFVKSEVSALEQVEGFTRNFSKQTRAALEYSRWRGRMYNFRTEKENPGAEKIADEVVGALQGFQEFKRTGKTLSFEHVARNVAVGEVEKATTIVGELFKDTEKPEEVVELWESVKASLSRKRPLGTISKELTDEYLHTLSPKNKREVEALDRTFARRYRRAMREGLKETPPMGRPLDRAGRDAIRGVLLQLLSPTNMPEVEDLHDSQALLKSMGVSKSEARAQIRFFEVSPPQKVILKIRLNRRWNKNESKNNSKQRERAVGALQPLGAGG